MPVCVPAPVSAAVPVVPGPGGAASPAAAPSPSAPSAAPPPAVAAPDSSPKVCGETVRPSGRNGVPPNGVPGNGPVSALATAPAGSDNSVSEVPNRPLAPDSQITTDTVSPTAIFK